MAPTGFPIQTDAEVKPLDISIGLLTLPQAAAQLSPFGFPKDSDGMLLTKRLIARGSIKTTAVGGGGEPRIAIDDLKAFLSQGVPARRLLESMGKGPMPAETIGPIFPVASASSWFDASPWRYQVHTYSQSIIEELGRQLPPGIDAIEFWKRPSWGGPAPAEQMGLKLPDRSRNDSQIDVPCRATPRLLAILKAKPPMGTVAFPLPDASMFASTSEIYLAQRFQLRAQQIVQQNALADSSNILSQGADMLYESSEKYQAIIEAAGTSVISFGANFIFSQRVRPFNPASSEPQASFTVTVALTDAQLMEMAGSNLIRLAMLAF